MTDVAFDPAESSCPGPPLELPLPALSVPERSEGTWRLLFLAAFWLNGPQLLSGLIAGLVIAIHNAMSANNWVIPPELKIPVFTLVGQLIMLYGCRRRGRRVGNGDWRAGVGLGPLKRRRLLAGLILIHVLVVAVWVAVLSHFGISMPVVGPALDLKHGLPANSILVLVITFLAAGLMAPVVEEMFFRGWLWCGLKKRWPVLPVAMLTSTLWLLEHWPDGWRKLVVLLPSSVMFPIVRHYCGGTKASWAIHMINNLPFSIIIVAAIIIAQRGAP